MAKTLNGASCQACLKKEPFFFMPLIQSQP
jgi:hypothetical protein